MWLKFSSTTDDGFGGKAEEDAVNVRGDETIVVDQLEKCCFQINQFSKFTAGRRIFVKGALYHLEHLVFNQVSLENNNVKVKRSKPCPEPWRTKTGVFEKWHGLMSLKDMPGCIDMQQQSLLPVLVLNTMKLCSKYLPEYVVSCFIIAQVLIVH